jgi:hypothetical protein
MALLIAGAAVMGVAVLAMHTLRPITEIGTPKIPADLHRILKRGRENGYVQGFLRRTIQPHATGISKPVLNRTGVPSAMAAVADLFWEAAAKASVASYERARAVQDMGYTRPSTKYRPRFVGHIQRKHAGKLADYPFARFELPDDRTQPIHDTPMPTRNDPYPVTSRGPEPGRAWDESAVTPNNIHYPYSAGGSRFRELRENVVRPRSTNSAVNTQPAKKMDNTVGARAAVRMVRFSNEPEKRTHNTHRAPVPMVQGRT